RPRPRAAVEPRPLPRGGDRRRLGAVPRPRGDGLGLAPGDARRSAVSGLRWGVIGAGGIATQRMIPGLLGAGHELLAVCRRDPVALAAVSARWGVAGHREPQELLADPRVEAVYVASPPAAHEAHAVAAAEAGKHVLL